MNGNTDIEKLEKRLASAEEERDFFRDTLNALHTMVSVVKPDGTIVWGNDTVLKLSCVTLEQVKGTSAYDRPEIPENDAKLTKSILDKVATGSHLELRETWGMTVGDSKYWALGLFTPISKNGKTEYIVTNTLDITARKEAEFALAKAKDELEEANKLKDQFVALVSHDLRSPLSSLSLGLDSAIYKGGITLTQPSATCL